jgi:hypothetical protein
MALTTANQVDILFKKLFGYARTSGSTNTTAESISSPVFLRGDNIWLQANQIPASPAALSGIVSAYTGNSASSTTAATAQLLASTTGVYQAYKTGLTDWIPPEFNTGYAVSVWVDTTGSTTPTSTGVQIFPDGTGGAGEWVFDYQSGVLNFIQNTLPVITGGFTSSKSLFIVGYRYIGTKGVYPSQTSNSGKYLTTDGTNVSWGTVSGSYTAPTIGSTTIASGTTYTTLPGVTSINGTTVPSSAGSLVSTTSSNTFISANGNGDPLIIQSSNAHGGTGYAGLISLVNSISGSTNPNKFIRINSTGAIQIINSAYTNQMLEITDAGQLTVGSINNPVITGSLTANGSTGTSGYYLQSTGSGIQWAAGSGGGGGSGTTTNALTIGTGLSGTSFNGSSAVTIAIDTTTTVDKTTAQTLTNKTLTSPVISTISNTGTITIPSTTGTLALTSGVINNSLTTTTGDLIYGSSANTPARLGIGSSGQVLTVVSGVPAWAASSGGSSGHTIANNGTTFTSETNLNFIGLTVVDNAGTSSTDVINPSGLIYASGVFR